MVLTVNESSWDDQGVEFSWCHKIRTVFLFVVKGRLFCSRARISATGGPPPDGGIAKRSMAKPGLSRFMVGRRGTEMVQSGRCAQIEATDHEGLGRAWIAKASCSSVRPCGGRGARASDLPFVRSSSKF